MTDLDLVLDIRGVSRAFGRRRVLDGVDLAVRAGEIVAVVGPSGCGKTTLLRISAGLDHEATGSLFAAPRRTLLFQDARLLPWLTVRSNVALGLKGQDRRRTDALLHEVGLGDRGDAWPRQLSGGEAQRAALARALVRSPSLLLLDEPFSSLDSVTRGAMHELLREVHTRHHPGIVLVTHDLDEAQTLADRILALDEGRLKQR